MRRIGIQDANMRGVIHDDEIVITTLQTAIDTEPQIQGDDKRRAEQREIFEGRFQ